MEQAFSSSWRAGGVLLAGALLLALPGCSRAPSTSGELPDVLRWGGDASGGEPYIIERANQPRQGFETELADYLARKLGIEGQFVQRAWENLPSDLGRGDIDVVLNGYEWSPQREQAMASTVPYFAYRLRLLVHRDSSITGWDDLRRRPGQPRKTVGVLSNSAAERYVKDRYGDDVEVKALSDEGTTGVMKEVENKGLDATVQDSPVISWYLQRQGMFRQLRAVGEPVRPVSNSYYVIFVRRSDTALKAKLDAAIVEGLRDGSLKKLYERYDLWDADQEGLVEAAKNWPPPGTGPPPSLWWFAGQLAEAALTTIQLALTAMPLAMLVGLLVAVARLYGPKWATWPLTVYVEVIRGTPVLLQLAVIYYGLPALGIRLDAFSAGVLGLALNYGAYEAENYRAGLLAVPHGQIEAALALGMSRWTALRRVIVPQAVRIVVPPVTNDFIALFKDTSVCSVFAVTELTARYRHLAVNNPTLLVELGVMTAILYLAMSYPLSLVARRLERRSRGAAG